MQQPAIMPGIASPSLICVDTDHSIVCLQTANEMQRQKIRAWLMRGARMAAISVGILAIFTVRPALRRQLSRSFVAGRG